MFKIFMQKAMIFFLQVCQGSVLATLFDVETGVDWYFRSCDEDGQDTDVTSNVVYREVFRNV
jgi:hypothetical protein